MEHLRWLLLNMVEESPRISNSGWICAKVTVNTVFFMQAVISSWLNLEETSHFQIKKRNYIRHEWLIVVFKIRRVHCPRNDKTPPLKKATGKTSRSKQKEGQKENKILFNKPWFFDVFVLLPVIIMQYL